MKYEFKSSNHNQTGLKWGCSFVAEPEKTRTKYVAASKHSSVVQAIEI